MKKSLYWELLPLFLIVVCFFGCSGSGDTNNDQGPIIYDRGWTFTEEKGPAEEKDPEKEPNIEQVLAELEVILVELETILAENNENVPEDETLVQDVKSPKMIGGSVKDRDRDVNLARVILIEFDEWIDTADVTLQIKDGDIVETRVIFRRQAIEIRRLGRGKDFHLKPLTTYVIKGTVADIVGNETKIEITFTTGEVILDDGF